MTYVKTPAAKYFEWGQIADFSIHIFVPCRRIGKSVEHEFPLCRSLGGEGACIRITRQITVRTIITI